jgi:hypothetical protein
MCTRPWEELHHNQIEETLNYLIMQGTYLSSHCPCQTHTSKMSPNQSLNFSNGCWDGYINRVATKDKCLQFFKLLHFGPFKFLVKPLSSTTKKDRFGLLKGGIFPFILEFDASNTAVNMVTKTTSNLQKLPSFPLLTTDHVQTSKSIPSPLLSLDCIQTF